MYKGKCWQLPVVVGYSCENDFDRLRSCEDDCLIIFYSEKEKLSVSSVSQPNFQFICHFFNQELNWKSQRAISLEKSLVGSNVDWSPVWAGLIWALILELESHFRRPRRRSPHSLTHTLRIWTHHCTNIFHNFSFQRNVQHLNQIYFLSDDQWSNPFLHTYNIRFRFKLVEFCLNSASNWVELRRSGNSLEFCIKWNYPLMMELLGWNCREKVEAQIASTGSS